MPGLLLQCIFLKTIILQNHNTIIKIWNLTFTQCCYLIYKRYLDFVIHSYYVLYSKGNPR